MIVHYILLFTDALKMAFINWTPSFGMPGFWSTYLPQIVEKIIVFNRYLPIVEALETVVFCIGCTLAFKIAKIVLGIVQVNLGA